MRAFGAGLLSLLAALAAALAARPRAVYTNHWAVRVLGGPGEADRLAAAYGYLNLGQDALHLPQHLGTNSSPRDNPGNNSIDVPGRSPAAAPAIATAPAGPNTALPVSPEVTSSRARRAYLPALPNKAVATLNAPPTGMAKPTGGDCKAPAPPPGKPLTC
ncbi:UNVERIFIED_CONTAM: hypothetical protein K2H54_025864 [Gekko kuhli]